MWVVEKVINNNVIGVVDEKGTEAILTGKGIGFQKKKGEKIEEEKIERIFLPNEERKSDRFEQISKDTPGEYIMIVTECIEHAKKVLGKELSANLYITLMEHLTLVVQRAEQGVFLKNPMVFDMKHFYPQEFEVAEYTREQMNRILNLELPIDETGFLTMHFLNAENTTNNRDMIMDITQFLQDILGIIEAELDMVLDTSTYEYARFITHLKYLAQKILEGTQEVVDDDNEFYVSVQAKHKEAFACVKKIVEYVKEKYEVSLSEEEKMYLTVYIKRNLLKMQKKLLTT